ncbi:hypothetical protein [Paenibacillus sonchi]|uniref:hypothetical protein n=1 Tax=Paenibacillus sonchi TaxID=373687 RepID=UPI001E641CB1|nr:hypothetical protein [Paenibacillus sonchi]MCE3202496.1 hypothetical protein [Paenibacillus sonchi]
MSVEIKIFGENAKEALQEIGGLAAALVGASAPATDKPAKTAKTQSTAKPAETKKEEQEKPETEDLDQNNTGDGDAEIPDDVALRAAALEKTKVVGKVKVKALLDQYGVPNVTGLPNDKRLDFLNELEGLS